MPVSCPATWGCRSGPGILPDSRRQVRGRSGAAAFVQIRDGLQPAAPSMEVGCGRGSRFAAGDPYRQREAVELVQGAEMPMQLDQPKRRSIIPGCLVVSVERRQPGALAAALRASRPRCMTIETEREADGRWIAEMPELPGVMVYGVTEAEACAKVTALAWRVSLIASAWAKRC